MDELIIKMDYVRDNPETPNHKLFMWCPACERVHSVDHAWSWNEDYENPTIMQAIVSRYTLSDGSEGLCRSFIRSGMWVYDETSTHALKGQKKSMVAIPENVAVVVQL